MFTFVKMLLALIILTLFALSFETLEIAISFGALGSATEDTLTVIFQLLHQNSGPLGILVGILLLSAFAHHSVDNEHVS